ncbi:penicillin-binding protein [Bacillus sp. OV322]|uniref:transglycosylase domain-containing protein n=1 Tax=Bacillus sp. OV322 TaxID=1882764 RepID=UPI0008F0BAAB|nr:transglycosylase domain-containing protein [Bacillus sp. OV322]SFC58187.1 penicillin-binding protein [Bacillus sp. OV322]
MKNNQDAPPSFWSKLTGFLQSKNTKRYSRITYQVIWNLMLLLIIIGVLGFCFAGGAGAGYFAALVKDEPVRPKAELKKDIYNYEETSELYFANNTYLGKLNSDLEREQVTLDHVSKYLSDAVVATEDEYFYEHHGVVPKALMRAIFQEMTNSSVQSGGSTLTQQLVKNQILTNEVSFDRKAKEILLALRLEKFFSKKEILQTYLNVSTFGRNSSGHNIAGVQSAAKGLFGKNASDLNIPQAAFIAGLPKNPFGYTPYTQQGKLKENLDPGILRMKTVLKRMRDGNYITQKQYEDALKYNLVKDFIGPVPSPSKKYPWVTYEIEKRSIDILSVILAKKDGYTESDLKKDKDLNQQYTTLASRNLRQNGYKIYSTINKKMYDTMQKVKNNYPYYGYDKQEEVKDPETKKLKTVTEPVETGAVLIENKTGKILSFVGGRNYKREQTNHATAALRPNGSTMKPLLVYGPSIELGKISPASPVANVPMSFGGWSPGNYGGSFSGLTTARHALAQSYNVPAAKFYMDIINTRPVTYLEKMGFTSLTKDDYTYPSMALGAMQRGVTVEENVNAYSTFANSGNFIDAYMIDKIETKDGKVIYQHKVKPVKVFTPQTAYLTLDMMRDVVNKGTAASVNNRLAFSSDWAGKTGTGQDYHDAWFVATNPNVTFGTWIGYDTPKSLKGYYKGLEYNKRNLYLWAELMNAAYKVKPSLIDPEKRFEMPGGIVRRPVCGKGGMLPASVCESSKEGATDLFDANFLPDKSDSKLIETRYVQIGNKQYAALSSTPDEFVSTGTIINPDYYEKLGGKYVKDPGSLMPKGDGGTAAESLRDNGSTPSAPSIGTSGSSIVWSSHPEADVIGYRIYKYGQKAGSTKAGNSLSYSGGSGSYYITAVDIAGNESAPSNTVSIGDTSPQKDTKPKDEPKKQEDKVKDPPPKDDRKKEENKVKETKKDSKPGETKPVEPKKPKSSDNKE